MYAINKIPYARLTTIVGTVVGPKCGSRCETDLSTTTHSNVWQEANVMEGRGYPPLAQGMQQHVVIRATLVAMELVEQAMAWV